MDKEAIVIPIRKLPKKSSISGWAARSYIADMLEGLCEIAANSEQNDLHELLKITHKAAQIANQSKS